MKTATLICEGKCNPDRLDLERIVNADRQGDDKGRMMAGPKVLLLRRLIHTPHTWRTYTARGHRYRCDICGHERKYG